MDNATSTSTQMPFRFLDLPKELRLMVYELLVTRRHYRIHCAKEGPATGSVDFILPDPIPPIHLSCSNIFSEATQLMQELGLGRDASRVVLDAAGATDLQRHLTLVTPIINLFYVSVSRVLSRVTSSRVRDYPPWRGRNPVRHDKTSADALAHFANTAKSRNHDCLHLAIINNQVGRVETQSMLRELAREARDRKVSLCVYNVEKYWDKEDKLMFKMQNGGAIDEKRWARDWM